MQAYLPILGLGNERHYPHSETSESDDDASTRAHRNGMFMTFTDQDSTMVVVCFSMRAEEANQQDSHAFGAVAVRSSIWVWQKFQGVSGSSLLSRNLFRRSSASLPPSL